MWLLFAKRGSGKKTVTYVEAVEEALCFGWIDTTVRRLDDHYFIQRFTPRSNELNWSKINQERFRRMDEQGLMTDAGRARRPAKLPPPPKRLSVDDPIPQIIQDALAKDPVAKKNFDSWAPGYRRDHMRRVIEAKQEETRQRRLKQFMQWLRENRKRVY